MTPAIGQRYRASWGTRYVLHRFDGDRAVLREVDSLRRCVVPTLEELATSGQYSADPAEIAPGEIASASPAAAPPALLLVELAPAPAVAASSPRRDRRPGAKPAASETVPAGDTSRCCVCGRRAIALVVVETHRGEFAYCSQCYGVSEQQASSRAAGALHTDWRPPPGEVHESRAEVGNFDPPPVEERRPAPPRPKPPPPPRVDAQAWLVGTGEVAR